MEPETILFFGAIIILLLLYCCYLQYMDYKLKVELLEELRKTIKKILGEG